MGTITINVNDEVENKFRDYVDALYSGKKGSLGSAVTEAMREWIRQRERANISTDAIKLLERGFDLGKRLYREREELHE
jgi:hypothetical protein